MNRRSLLVGVAGAAVLRALPALASVPTIERRRPSPGKPADGRARIDFSRSGKVAYLRASADGRLPCVIKLDAASPGSLFLSEHGAAGRSCAARVDLVRITIR